MGVVTDVTVKGLTTAVTNISATGMSDSTGQAIVTSINNLRGATSPIITDDTGQDIKTAINALANAVKPDASDIKYDSSTTVKGKIDEVDDILGNKLNVTVMSSGSMNNITSSGLYYLGNSVTDKPINTGGMFIAMFGNPNVAVGFYIGYVTGTNAVYRSNYSNGTWTHYAL